MAIVIPVSFTDGTYLFASQLNANMVSMSVGYDTTGDALLGNMDVNDYQLLSARAENLVADPGSAAGRAGRLFYNSVTKNLGFDDGAAIQKIPLYTESTWTPVWTGATVVAGAGAVVYTGRYMRIGRMVFFTCLATVSVDATLETTIYITHFTLPVAPAFDGVGVASKATGASIHVGVGNAHISLASGSCWVPTMAAYNGNLVISGQYEV